MSLSELMSSLELSIYPQIALVLFLVVFAGVAWRIISMPKQEIRDAENIPLDDTEHLEVHGSHQNSSTVSAQIGVRS